MKQNITDVKKDKNSVVFSIWENPVPKGRPRSTVKNNKINSEVLAITTTSFLESVSANLPP